MSFIHQVLSRFLSCLVVDGKYPVNATPAASTLSSIFPPPLPGNFLSLTPSTVKPKQCITIKVCSVICYCFIVFVKSFCFSGSKFWSFFLSFFVFQQHGVHGDFGGCSLQRGPAGGAAAPRPAAMHRAPPVLGHVSGRWYSLMDASKLIFLFIWLLSVEQIKDTEPIKCCSSSEPWEERLHSRFMLTRLYLFKI